MDNRDASEFESRFFRSRGLRIKLMLSFTLLVLVTTGIMFWLTYQSAGDLAADRVRHRLNLLSGVFANELEREIDLLKQSAENLARDPGMQYLDSESGIPQKLARKHLNGIGFDKAVIPYFTPYGVGCMGCNKDNDPKWRFIRGELEKRISENANRTLVFELPLSISKKPGVFVAVPFELKGFRDLFDVKIKKAYVVLEKDFTTTSFEKLIGRLELGASELDTYLVNRKGVIIANKHDAERGRSIIGPEMPLASMSQSGGEKDIARLGRQFTYEQNKEKYLGASMPVSSELGWKVIVVQPYKEVADAVFRLGNKIIFVGAIALLTAFALALYRAHRVITPIGELLAAVDEISRGDYRKRVKVRRRDEIGSLALAFNRMTSTLEEKITALQESQSQLREAFHQLTLDAQRRKQTNLDLLRKVKELTSISEITQAISNSLDQHIVLNTIVDTINKVMGFKHCSIKLLDKKSNSLLIRVSSGLGEEYLSKRPTVVGHGISGRAAKERQPVIIEDLASDARVPEDHILVKLGIQAMISYPLLTRDNVMGVLNIYSNERHIFNEDELRLLAILANQAASAIQNATLYDDLRESYLNTIQALSMTIDAKDPYTHGHSKRVSEISVLIGNQIGLDADQLELLKYAGDLHDIGKIGISELIIAKEGKLTVDEYEIVKTHPLVGETIIEPVPFLSQIKEVIRHHHERYDGYGYPDGLTGETIPQMSRIILIADSYDAMTSDRPYRKALTHDEAVIEIRKHGGTQFDPALVEAFLSVFGPASGQQSHKAGVV